MTTDQKKVLRRSRSNRMIAGVCGGLAEFFGISAFWFRLGMFIAFIPGGVPGYPDLPVDVVHDTKRVSHPFASV